MGKFRVTFYDSDDWPIDYGAASIALARHDFDLGVTMKTRPMSSMAAADYLWYLRTAGKHFWSGAITDQMLWAQYEPSPGDVAGGQKAVDDMLMWANSQHWGSFSATLLDGGHTHKEHWSNQLACKELRTRLHERIAREMSHFLGKIHLYEVWRGALHWREWIDRCGESLFFDAYKWAQQADPNAILCPSEADVLTTLTLTNAESYHNLVWRLKDQGIPIRAVCVQAVFDGEVDASTVKHRLDVLLELHLPVYITDFAINNLDPAKHAYELEKFVRLAFSHDAIAGIILGDLWDRSAPSTMFHGVTRAATSGLYSANKQAKPAATRLDRLWKEEWHTAVHKEMNSEGTVNFDGYYGKYTYHLTADDGKECAGSIDLLADPSETKHGEWGRRGADGEAQVFVVKCSWEGHVHIPVWTTPAFLALSFVACLFMCWRQKAVLESKKGAPGRRIGEMSPAPRRTTNL